MRSLIHEIATQHPPEALTEQLRGEPGLVLLSSGACDWPQTRYSFVAARPFLTFRSFGSRCELRSGSAIGDNPVQFGNPWHLLESLMSRYELLDEVDLPFPLGGCFGYWGYGLKNFVEPRLPRRAANDLELPDCHVGFYDSLVVFDHWLGKTWIISTGLEVDGSRNEEKRQRQLKFWRGQLQKLTGTDAVSGTKESCGPTRPSCGYLALNSDFSLGAKEKITPPIGSPGRDSLRCARAVGRPAHEAPPLAPFGQAPQAPIHPRPFRGGEQTFVRAGTIPLLGGVGGGSTGAMRPQSPEDSLPVGDGRAGGQTGACSARVVSNFSRRAFLAAVERAQDYIRAGDIYQVNLAQRLAAACPVSAWEFFLRLSAVSPAPFAAFLDCGEFQIASSSPELFLRLDGSHIQTRPIKGTRPRDTDPARDAQLREELQTSPKEMAELVMITDLLRNDLGKVCEYGSVQVPELARLERYAQVQHLVATVEGRLRPGVTHLAAFASCFPGGSITGAPKIRAMEIIDELEPTARGPYTGALGCLGFNRESRLSILIRAAICRKGTVYFQVGAGIVADSVPAAEYNETLAKARGFFEALNFQHQSGYVVSTAES